MDERDLKYIKRFIEKIIFMPSGCVEWNGFRHKKGYGAFRMPDRVTRAHRASYELFIGPIPDGVCVLHRCDNPSCVRPNHLFLGTNQDNIDDRESKRRGVVPRLAGENSPRAKLRRDDVVEILKCDKSIQSKDLAKKYNISRSIVERIRNRTIWKSVTV